jgi:hypothetical protein
MLARNAVDHLTLVHRQVVDGEARPIHGRQSHLRTTLYIPLGILYRKYTAAHANDFTATASKASRCS